MPSRPTSRRRFIRNASLSAASLALAGRLGAQPPATRARRPNVLFIAIDDLNDWTGYLGGNPDAKTPHLDRLAARGIAFTNAHTNGPVCNPARTTAMTGVLPSTSGVYGNNQPWRNSPVLHETATIPGHFRANGYHALGTGKLFHQDPDGRSWDQYWPSKKKPRPGDPRPDAAQRPLNGLPKTGAFDWGPLDVGNDQMSDWKVTDWAVEQLGQRYEKPFFFGCGIFRPHLPWYVPQAYFDRFDRASLHLPELLASDLDDLPKTGKKIAATKDHRTVLGHDQWRAAIQGYLASSAFADDCLGRLIEALDASPHAADTIIVLWSDHGWHFGEKLHWRKLTLWEETTRIPLLVIPPGGSPAARCDAPISLVDLYPTLTDLCDLPTPAGLDGHSFAPLLERPTAPWAYAALTTHGRGNHAVRTERWRYIRYADGGEELYDHRNDPNEWTNLADQPDLALIKGDLMRHFPTHDAKAVADETPQHKKKNPAGEADEEAGCGRI